VEKDVQRVGLPCSNLLDRPNWRVRVRGLSLLTVKR
jgi:hypothetical protein